MQKQATKNTLYIIRPFKIDGTWIFTDKEKGLENEPFVEEAGNIIDFFTKDIKNAHKGFNLIFSDKPFPGSIEIFTKKEEEHGGAWYKSESTGMKGWLCPALHLYFPKSPDKIYAQFKEKK